jgi:outer membrane murein-binding lipoprotein Lpp
MRPLVLVVFASLFLVGCASPKRIISSAPHISVVKSSVERVAEKAGAAKATSERVIEKMQVVYRDGAAPGSSAVAEIQTDVRQIRGDLEAALVETQNTKEQIEKLRKIDAEREEAMVELRDDLEQAEKALRSRTKSLLVVVLIACGLAIYILRTPLLNSVAFLARKIGGIPW